MTQAKIRENILNIVRGEMAYADPMSKVCLEQNERHPEKFPLGSTFQSAEEVLEDIITRGGMRSLSGSFEVGLHHQPMIECSCIENACK